MSGLYSNLMRQLVLLRWLALAGQCLAVLVTTYTLGIALPTLTLAVGIVLLGAFNLWASWRTRAIAPVRAIEVMAHVAVDIASLAFMIAWSGGAMNPFTSLFLLPVALVAVALPPVLVISTAMLAAFGYATAVVFAQPLPHVHGLPGSTLDLHLAGMAINFVISTCVFAYFLTRLAQALRDREAEVSRLHEQFTRNEGLVALATHAASVAHELNTPLGTLTLLVEDQLAQPNMVAEERRDDLETMAAILNDCRDRVRALALPNAGISVEQSIARWQLLRPTIALDRTGTLGDAGHTVIDAGIGHLLLALLNNAADASEAAGSHRVELHLEQRGERLAGEVRDHGHGVREDHPLLPGTLFQSTKTHGLGIGLVLSHATVERLGGQMALSPAADGGTRVAFELAFRQAS